MNTAAAAVPTACRLGYEEHDGARYCFEHAGFLEAGVQSRRCDRAWRCPTCGFDAKAFEPRPEGQWGALRYHMALHESGRAAFNEAATTPADRRDGADAEEQP